MSHKPERQKLRLGPVEVEYARFGNGSPLIILHGGSGPVDRNPFALHLAKSFEVIAPVHPGFDGTAIPDHFDRVEDLVFLYLDLLDALDLGNPVLMGLSFGGWIAAELASLDCARFSRIILVDAVGIKPGDRESRDIADVFGHSAGALDRLLWHDPANAPDLTKMDDAELAKLAGDRVALGAYCWEPYMHNPKLRHRLHRVRVPTLFIWGASDGVVAPHYGAAFRDLISGAKLTIIPNAGHMPYLEQPEAFLNAVMSFCRAKAA